MIKVIDKEYRNIQEQVKKNKDDIQTLYSVFTNYFVAGDNVVIELINNNTQARISATLETAIDDSLSTSSTNPVQNKVITNALGNASSQIKSLDTRVRNNYQSIQLLQIVKQDKLTAGDNITIIDNEISATDTNIYPIPYYNSGLKVTHSSDSDNNKDIFIPYASNTQAGIVTKQFLQTLIAEVLPELVTPEVGQTIHTLDSSFNPNTKYPNTTWRKFKDGIYFGSGNVVEFRKEQLPNLKWKATQIGLNYNDVVVEGITKSKGGDYGNTNKGNNKTNLSFNAHNVNSVYTDNGKVRPNTITEFVWVRVDGLSQAIMDVISPYLEA